MDAIVNFIKAFVALDDFSADIVDLFSLPQSLEPAEDSSPTAGERLTLDDDDEGRGRTIRDLSSMFQSFSSQEIDTNDKKATTSALYIASKTALGAVATGIASDAVSALTMNGAQGHAGLSNMGHNHEKHHEMLIQEQRMYGEHAHMQHNNMQHMSNHGSGMDMAMSFQFSCKAEILFSWWQTSSCSTFWLSMAVIFGVAILHQWTIRKQVNLGVILRKNVIGSRHIDMNDGGGNYRSMPVESGQAFDYSTAHSRASKLVRRTEAMLFGFNVALGYLLMLITMTYNTGLFMAVVLGATAGHYMFPPSVPVAGNCH